MKIPKSVLISRIDSVGDVVLALPVAGMLKKCFPGIRVALLASKYTKSIAVACEHIDDFIDIEYFLKNNILINGSPPGAILHLITNPLVAKRAKQIKIPVRIGTMSRLYHWFYCNRLLWLSRRNAGLHEAQANLKLLAPFGVRKTVALEEIPPLYGLTKFETLSDEFRSMINKDKFNIILHPKSKGNAREWPGAHFINLINSLDPTVYKIFLSGVESEKADLQQIMAAVKNPVINLAGRISLAQFISLIATIDCMVANSTGPLHIAAALGKHTLGIYPSLTPKNPLRWGPVGINARTFVFKKSCTECKNTPHECRCINSISPAEIKAALDKIAGDQLGNVVN